MAKIVKATPEQKKEYAKKFYYVHHGVMKGPLYPLYGFIKVAGVDCVIEYLGEGEGGVDYEVMAPDNFHFNDGDQLHSLCCHSLTDVRQRAAAQELEPCTDDCGGKSK